MRKKPRRSRTSSNEDSIGYGRPPMHTRWKKGKSGNPKGRPRGRKNQATMFIEIIHRKVRVNENGKVRSITLLEAIITTLCANAVKGDKKAIELILKLQPEMERLSPPTITEILGGMTLEEASAEYAKILRPLQ